MKKRLILGILFLSFILIGYDHSTVSSTAESTNTRLVPIQTDQSGQSCTSFCLDNGDRCLFGTNQDNQIDAGLLFVNKRNVLKTGWESSTSGDCARWVSKYGSVTFVHAGYQLVWAGMNEAGLMISTMELSQTGNPHPDKRPPLASSFWVQYQLDNYSSVEEVLASDSQVRIADTVDHYLVSDRSGNCAVIEFLEGKMAYHSGESLPVKALTNTGYQDSVSAWEDGRDLDAVQIFQVEPGTPPAEAGLMAGDRIIAIDEVKLNGKQPLGELFSRLLSNHDVGEEMVFTIRRSGHDNLISVPVKLVSRTTKSGEVVLSLGGALSLSTGTALVRFATVADRLRAFEPASPEEAVDYAFSTLKAAAQQNTAWSIVFDPAVLRVYFMTNKNPEVRWIDFSTLDFSCQTPVMMLDIHTDISGDIHDALEVYSHEKSLKHSINYFKQYERINLPSFIIDGLLRGFESFPCQADEVSTGEDAKLHPEKYRPLLPPRVIWVVRAVFQRIWPIWLLVTLLSLGFLIWRQTRSPAMSWGKRLVWMLIVIVLSVFGLLIYLLTHRKRPSHA